MLLLLLLSPFSHVQLCATPQTAAHQAPPYCIQNQVSSPHSMNAVQFSAVLPSLCYIQTPEVFCIILVPDFAEAETNPVSVWYFQLVTSSRVRKQLSSKTFFNKIQKQCVHAKSLQSCSTFCNSVGCSPPSSSVHGIFRSGLPCPPHLGNLPDPGIEPMSLTYPPLVGGFFTTSTTWEAWDFPGSDVFPEKL